MIFLTEWTAAELLTLDIGVLARVFKSLLRAHAIGTHLVILGRETAAWANDHLKLDPEDTATVLRLRGEYTQTRGLLASAPTYVSVQASACSVERKGSALHISVPTLDASRLLERPTLVTENLRTDGVIYKIMIEEAARSKELNICDIDLVHGGGDDTPFVFLQEIQNKKTTAVVLDSDMKSPFTKQSEKAKKIKQMSAISEFSSIAVVIPCQEIENVIPLPLLEAFVGKTHKKVLRMLMGWNQSEKGEEQTFCRYHDFCDGLSTAKLAGYEEADRKWIEERLKRFGFDIDRLSIPGLGKPLIRLTKNVLFIEALRASYAKCAGWAVRQLSDLVWIFVAQPRRIT